MTPQIKERIAQIKKGEIPQGYKATEVGIVPCEWEVVSLGQISALCGGGTPSTARKDFWGGHIPWVSSSDIGVKGIFDIAYKKFITDEAIKNSATKLCPANSVLIVSRVGVGKVALSTQACCTSQDFTNVIESSVNRELLAYILIKKINAEIQKVQGTSIKGITTAELKSYKLSYPIHMDEQDRIVEILSAQDKVIALKEKLIAQKQEQKKHLMQSLLTGKQRLKGFSGEWESKKLGDICRIQDGYPLKSSSYSASKKDIQVIRISDINNKNKNSDKVFIEQNQIAMDNLDSYLVSKGDLLLSLTGAAGFNFFIWESGKAILNQRTVKFIFEEPNENMRYLLEGMLHQYLNEKGTGQNNNLSKDDLVKSKINLPSPLEQEAIAKILTTADKEIELLQKQLEQETQRKKSLMQLLLTGIVRV